MYDTERKTQAGSYATSHLLDCVSSYTRKELNKEIKKKGVNVFS